MEDLIEEAKKKIGEEVEFYLAPEPIETEMQERGGEMARYDIKSDIIYYSSKLIEDRTPEFQIQTFSHELAHAKDLRSCVANGLLKALISRKDMYSLFLEHAGETLHAATEFQVSNFLYSKFCYRLFRSPKFEQYLANGNFLSIIPSIEYFYFGEDRELREHFELKLDNLLNQRWLSVASLLNALHFADSHSFETEFVRLASCFGFTIQIKNISIEEGNINMYKILENYTDQRIKVFELINFEIGRSIFQLN